MSVYVACCDYMQDDVADARFVWITTRKAWARMDAPKRRVSWKVAINSPAATINDGMPYMFTTCPHCGRDIPDKP